MEIPRLKIILLGFLLIALALQQAAYAVNLGTLQKSYSANIASGEAAAFQILFWNAGSDEYPVQISEADAPEGWIIIATPKEFRLNSTPSGKIERIYLPSAKNTIGAKVVDVYAAAPKGASIGEYVVALKAITGENKGTESGFSLFQERRFSFKINVVRGSPQKSDKDAGTINKTVLINTMPLIDEKISYDYSTSDNGQVFLQNLKKERTVGYALLILAIMIIAWRIYKYD